MADPGRPASVLERKRGKIVVVGSATNLRGRKGGVAVYGAARGAQRGYMKNVAMEVAPYVNINGTAQTYVDNITYWPMEYRETAEFRERMAENPARAWPLVASARKPCYSSPGRKAIFPTVRSSRLPAAGRCKHEGRSHAVPAYSEGRPWGRTRQLPSAGANGR